MKKYINAERLCYTFVIIGLFFYIWLGSNKKNENEIILKEQIKNITAQKDSLYKQVDLQGKNIKKSIQKIDSLKKDEYQINKKIDYNEYKIKKIENAKPVADSALLDFFTNFATKNK